MEENESREISEAEEEARALTWLVLGANPYLDFDLVLEELLKASRKPMSEHDFLKLGIKIAKKAKTTTSYFGIKRVQ